MVPWFRPTSKRLGIAAGPGSSPVDRRTDRVNDSSVVASRNAEIVGEAAALLSAVADPIRLQLLNQLAARTSCVCDLQVEPEIPGNLLSYHLKVLREAGVLVAEREGKEIYFHVDKASLQQAFGKVSNYLDTWL